MNLGGIYKGLGNSDDALACTLKSLELNPDNPAALLNLGVSTRVLVTWTMHLHTAVLRAESSSLSAHLNLGRIYIGLGNLDDALTCILKSLSLNLMILLLF